MKVLLKLTLIKETKLGSCAAGSIVKILLRYCTFKEVLIMIVLYMYCESFKGKFPTMHLLSYTGEFLSCRTPVFTSMGPLLLLMMMIGPSYLGAVLRD